VPAEVTDRETKEATMKELNIKRRRLWRRRWVTGTGLVALLLVIAAVAWACTAQVGTLKVCSPVPLLDVQGGKCGSKTASGNQAGGTASSAGSAMSITASGMSAAPYSILYTNPANFATSNCHQAGAAGVTSILGTTSGQPNTLMGPNFSIGTHVSTLTGGPSATIPAGGGTGPAKLCVQDYPNRVTGNQIVMTII